MGFWGRKKLGFNLGEGEMEVQDFSEQQNSGRTVQGGEYISQRKNKKGKGGRTGLGNLPQGRG